MINDACLAVTNIVVRVGCLGAGITLCVISHGALSPILYEGVLLILTTFPGCEPPMWAFAVPLI